MTRSALTIGGWFGFSVRQAGVIAGNTLHEAVRQRHLHVLLVLAAAAVVGARWLRAFDFGASELKFLADCGFGAMALFGAALVITATTQLYFSEIEHRTVLTLLAKPVARAEFIMGKLLGVAALAAIYCAFLTGLLAAVLRTCEAQLMASAHDALPPGGAVQYANLVIAGGLQWCKLMVLAAFTLLIASFAQSAVFAIVMSCLVFVIGHLQYLAQNTAAGNAFFGGGPVVSLISMAFPNFQVFAAADSISAAEALPWSEAARVAAYGAVYVAAAGGLAVYSFRRREL